MRQFYKPSFEKIILSLQLKWKEFTVSGVLNIFTLLSTNCFIALILLQCTMQHCQVVNHTLHLLFLFTDVTSSSSESKTSESQLLIFFICAPQVTSKSSNSNWTSELLLQKVTQNYLKNKTEKTSEYLVSKPLSIVRLWRKWKYEFPFTNKSVIRMSPMSSWQLFVPLEEHE